MEAQILQNAYSKKETHQLEQNTGKLANKSVAEVILQEKHLQEIKQRSQQELLRTAWDDQIARTKVQKNMQLVWQQERKHTKISFRKINQNCEENNIKEWIKEKKKRDVVN